MRSDRAIALFLRLYVCVVFCFVFAPIAASFVFSFNSDRFPTIPLGGFTLHWYETVYNDPDVWDALGVSLSSALAVSFISTFIGFCTAYRYRFFGKGAYLAVALLPPTIPLVIMGLAMLAWLSHVGLSGRPISIIIAHVVLCTPFAMADRVVIMSDGEIAQTGSPREVYRNPANRFVAEFVGTNNILTGRVAGLEAERIGIDTELGRFRAARPDRPRLEEGRQITFVVSADLVQLSDAESALENRLACTLISEEFVGSMVTLFLEAEEGFELRVQASQRVLERLDLSGATTVFASWSPEHVHILPGD